MELWLAVRYLHLLALAFFVGGQLMLAAVVVPVARRSARRDELRTMAGRFGWGSLIALLVLFATGSAMATDFERWRDPTLHAKLALFAVAGAPDPLARSLTAAAPARRRRLPGLARHRLAGRRARPLIAADSRRRVTSFGG